MELHCHTCYSFREGASTPRQLLKRAAELGYEALAITDRDGLYGAMEFAREARAVGVRPIIGADVTLQGGYRLVLLAATREGYANLCRLNSNAHLNADCGLRNAESGPIRNPQSEIRIPMEDLARHTKGLIALSGDEHGEVPSLIATGQWERAVAAARRYAAWFGPDNFFIELQHTLTFGDSDRNRGLRDLARQLGLGVVATNDVWYHVRERHRLHDVLVAIKHRATLDSSHQLRHANSERYLKSAEEVVALFADVPEALVNTVAIAERCQFDLMADLGYEFPHAAVPPGETPDTYLERICRGALDRKYPPLPPSGEDGEPRAGPQPPSTGSGQALTPSPHRAEAEARLDEELQLIRKHGLAGFFLAYYDLLELAGRVAAELRGHSPSRPGPPRLGSIPSPGHPNGSGNVPPNLPPDERPVGRGRGSSVSSIVCYLIGLSHIDPIANELFLGRFLNDELPSVPDIDLDFPRDIREEILKRIWAEFDEGRAALVCAYTTYRPRSAVRDVGKALGLPAVEIDHLASGEAPLPLGRPELEPSSVLGAQCEGGGEEARRSGPPSSSLGARSRPPEWPPPLAGASPLWRDLVELTEQLIGLPRHATQHVGGVVLSARPLQEFVPLEPTRMEGRVMCQWDKDAVDDARMVKIDFLALGMLSLVDECLDVIEQRHGQRPDLGRISHDDPEVYDRICAGDTIGLFQIESRAQIATLLTTQPRNLDDLAVQVAIVRPGPIVGGAFKPFMEYRRRLREGEPVEVQYIHPCLEPVLKDTLGVVLYQEQVLQVAMAVAGYTAGEADQLRRNLGRRRGAEIVEQDWPDFRDRAVARGIPEEAAAAAFKSILGFAAYGFPKSHAVAFGLLAYESAWLRYHYPAEYYAALLNNQPMGFYSPEVIVGDARRHGIEIVRPDVNLSGVGCVVEPGRQQAIGNRQQGSGSDASPTAYCLLPTASERVRLGLVDVKGVGSKFRVPSSKFILRQAQDERPLMVSLSNQELGTQNSELGTAELIVAEREAHGPYRSLFDFANRTGLKPEAIENLIMAGAFDGMRNAECGMRNADGLGVSCEAEGVREERVIPYPSPLTAHTSQLTRRELLWQLGLIRNVGYHGEPSPRLRVSASPRLPLAPNPQPLTPNLPPMTEWEELSAEYEVLGLSPQGQAMQLLREQFGVPSSKFKVGGNSELGTMNSELVRDLPDGAEVRMAGLVVCRQRPSTAKNVVFVSLEDEYGIANLVVYPQLFDRQRALLMREPFLVVQGRVQRQGPVVHIVAHRFERLEVPSERLIRVSHDFR